jgi:hypothetical protein
MKASLEAKTRYLQAIFDDPNFTRIIFYTITRDSQDYQVATLLSIASSVTAASGGRPTKTVVVIDGLKRTEQLTIGTGLRRIGISTAKVRGVADEGDALVRLADAIAGLVRDADEGKSYAQALLASGIRKHILQAQETFLGS